MSMAEKKADDLEAGHELDDAMAREVMGWRKDGPFWRDDRGLAPYSVIEWRPSTDINLCFVALHHTRWYVELRGSEQQGALYSVRVWKTGGLFYDAIGHPAEGLCRATIKAARNDITRPPITG